MHAVYYFFNLHDIFLKLRYTRSSAFYCTIHFISETVSFKNMSEHAVGAGAVIGSSREKSKERRQVQPTVSVLKALASLFRFPR